MIGQPSDWHRLNPRYFDSDLHYVPTKVKIDATKPVVDKLFYVVPQSGTLGTVIIWVHYEKIKRICTYCAKLFHNAEQCSDRAQSILVAGEDQGFDRFGLWMTQVNRIPLQLAENLLTAYQDVVPGPSSALQELWQAFVGVRMGTSMVQPPWSLHAFQGIPSHTSADDTFGILVATTADDMILDNLALVPVTTHQNETEILQSLQNQLQQIVPVSIPHGTTQLGQIQQQQSVPTTVHQQTEPTHTTTWIQNHYAYIPSSQVATSQQAMLQFTQYNIQQTQVQVQVTTQVDTYPIISTQRHPQPTIAANNESLPLNYPPITALLMSLPLENQFTLPHLPPEPRASPPQQRQRRIPLHPTGQNRNHAFDKGKEVITHVPLATVAPPQTLATGINQQLPMGEAMNLNFSPQQLQAYETLLALGILDGTSTPDPVTLDHLMECLDLQTPLHFPEPSPVNIAVHPTRTPLPLSTPTLPLTQPHPPTRSTPPAPPLRRPSLRHHHIKVPHHIPVLLILLLCSPLPRAMAES
jgi:hypothetical protein